MNLIMLSSPYLSAMVARQVRGHRPLYAKVRGPLALSRPGRKPSQFSAPAEPE